MSDSNYAPKTGAEILKWNRAAANAANQGARYSAAAGIGFTNPFTPGSIADSMTTNQSIIPKNINIEEYFETFISWLSKLSMTGKIILVFGILAFLVILKD
jgi:hypothetical protein